MNALSVDVEEYFHAAVFREGASGCSSHQFPSRVERNMDRVLLLLRREQARATCFVLGELAEAHPGLIRKIDQEGHEIACHGYRHELVCNQTPEQFRNDLRRAKKVLQDLIGKRVVGFRAPNFSIGRYQSWAYDVLLEEGFLYDSSIYPIVHDKYGQPDGPRFPCQVRSALGRDLVEFPVGTLRLLGFNVPIGGGGFFRLSPEKWTRFAIRRVNRQERQPIMFYFHPWELDPEQPMPSMAWRHRARLTVGIAREEAKLALLLRHHSFRTATDILWPAGIPQG
jgi:polysaccharide deacetylase family protein (PEP-CTERM system associated)